MSHVSSEVNYSPSPITSSLVSFNVLHPTSHHNDPSDDPAVVDNANEANDANDANDADVDDPTGQYFQKDPRKRQKKFSDCKQRIVKTLNQLGTACGAYGIVYLRSYDQLFPLANDSSAENAPLDKYIDIMEHVWVTSQIQEDVNLANKVYELFEDYRNSESVARKAQQSSHTALVIEKRAAEVEKHKALAALRVETQEKEKAHAELESLRAHCAELERASLQIR